MSKRTLFTTITPLPAGVTRQIVLDFLHDNEDMIDLNPLVKERHPIPTPPHAPADELHCQWYSLTDKISYFPGVTGDVTYTCAFNNLPTGVQTHCYAPAGLTIREKWTLGGSLPGEPPQPVELGLRAPPTGLYLREDVDMRCNVIMTSFVKKTLKKSHAALVDRLRIKAEIASTASKSRGNRISAFPEPNNFTAMESIAPSSVGSISSQYHHLTAFAPPSRSSSAASSASSYSVQSSSMWSPAGSSLGTSSAPSVSSPPPTTHSSNYQPRPGEYIAQQQPKQQQQQPLFPAQQQPPTLPDFVPEPPLSITLSAAPAPEPDTPFLRSAEPDWPLKAAPPPALFSQQQPNWPLNPQQQQQQRPRPRPQTHLFIQAYRPAANHAVATSPMAAAVGGGGGGGSGAKLSDDALWQALGGGRVGTGAAEVARGVNLSAVGYNNNTSYHQHSRARSQG
ncbi:hypothetical protein C8A01DRAFT_47418 [Parachaetomium inaequale]|uniref:DUF7053 domain-containing protein n=1 Tax=Parachaetomium inaequale TaxID=2588326 RepID=A0AAN6SR52_9PEZI|nr:hypothetical protein C8A01DRAFT_47418 [Parachaetomium inaequale]